MTDAASNTTGRRGASVPFVALAAVAALASCARQAPLDAAGTVSAWMQNPDPALAAVADDLPGLDFSFYPVDTKWRTTPSAPVPDLAFVEWGSDLSDGFGAGTYADLDSFWKRIPAVGSILRGAVAASTYAPMTADDRPRRAFLPAGVTAWGLYCNEAVLSGLDLPVPADWKAFVETVEAVGTAGGVPVSLGAAFGTPALAWLSFMDMRLNGAKAYLDLVAGDRSFDDPSFVRACEELARWRDSGWFGSGAGTREWTDAMADVADGRAAFTLMSATALERRGGSPGVRFVPVPFSGRDRSGLATVWGFALSASAEAPEAALALASAYVSAGGTGQAARPARVGVMTAGAADGQAPVPPDGSTVEAHGAVAAAYEIWAPQLDKALAPQAAYDSARAITMFFSGGMTGAELARLLKGIRP